MIDMYAPDTWAEREIDAVLLRRLNPIAVRLGQNEYRFLIQESVSHQLTIGGDSLPIFEAYRRDHPEAVPMHHVATWSGGASTQRYPEVTGRVMRHMRCLKRAFGVSHIKGVVIERVADPSFREVVAEPWSAA